MDRQSPNRYLGAAVHDYLGPRSVRPTGGLLAYGNDVTDNYRGSATFDDRVLRGEKPSGLPIQLPIKLDLALDLKTENAFVLTVAPTLKQNGATQICATGSEVKRL